MIVIKKEHNKFKLYLDGEVLPSTNVKGEFTSNKEAIEEAFHYRIYVNASESSKKLLPYKLSEIQNIKLISLQFNTGNKWKKIIINKLDKYFDRYSLSIDIAIKKKKRGGFPFNNFCEELEKVIVSFNNENLDFKARFERARYRNITVSFREILLPLSLGEEINKYSDVLEKLQLKTVIELEKKKNEFTLKSLVTSFNFPKELKIACEQYLIYFAEFLRDLNINVVSEFKEQAGKVLFSVTPTDDFEALDKIREALAIYLSLPSNPIPHSTGDKTVDMVLSGARANIRHLESQLELAIAKLQFKEATLELKDATIEQHQITLRQKDETIKELQEILLRGKIFEESLERVEINDEVVDAVSLYRFSREDDIEVEATPILDESNEETRVGLVKVHEVTKFKDYGLTFDLPKAIRDLMDFFKRNKKE